MSKVTKADVENWIGSDNLVKDLLEVVTDVANGDYTAESLNADIRSYSNYGVEQTMTKEEVMTLLLTCSICELDLRDTPQHIEEWFFANVDGANVPVCWGCNDMIESGYPL